LTHEQYLDEPLHVVDWALEFSKLENEMERDQMKRAQKDAESRR